MDMQRLNGGSLRAAGYDERARKRQGEKVRRGEAPAPRAPREQHQHNGNDDGAERAISRHEITCKRLQQHEHAKMKRRRERVDGLAVVVNHAAARRDVRRVARNDVGIVRRKREKSGRHAAGERRDQDHGRGWRAHVRGQGGRKDAAARRAARP